MHTNRDSLDGNISVIARNEVTKQSFTPVPQFTNIKLLHFQETEIRNDNFYDFLLCPPVWFQHLNVEK